MPYRLLCPIVVITCHVIKKYTSTEQQECERAHIVAATELFSNYY